MNLILQDLIVNSVHRTVHQDGNPLKLPDLSFDVLMAILSSAPQPISSEELTEKVWKSRHISDDTLAQRIKLLRKAIGDSSKSPRYIRTVRGVGYAALGDVKTQDTKSEPKVDPVSKTSGNTPSSGNLARRFTLAAVLSAVIAILIFTFYGEPEENPIKSAENQEVLSHSDIMVQRARQQLGLHQAEETLRAIDMLKQVLQEQPNHFEARLTLSFALSTKTTKFGGDYDEEKYAEALARDLIKEHPTNSNVWSALGYTLNSQGRSDEALAAYRQAYTLDPQNAAALSSAGHVLLLAGDFQQALLLEAQVLESGKSSRYSEIQIAQILQLIGHKAANLWLLKAMASNPGQAVVLAEAARFHIRNGNPQIALQVLSQYPGKDISSPQIPQLKGRVFAMLGQTQAAKNALKTAGWAGYAFLAALHAKEGDNSVFEALFPAEQLNMIMAGTEAEMRIQLAEIYAAMAEKEHVYREISAAINLGWRDEQWLQHSPFLKEFMESETGQSLTARIAREVNAQRSLVQQTPDLSSILSL